MIILANLYNNETGVYSTKKFNSFDEFYDFTFSPIWDVLNVFGTGRIHVRGICKCLLSKSQMTDREKVKSWLREFAIAFQETFSYDRYNIYDTWCYSELQEIGDYFEKYGRRYGLLEEFRENGII